MEIIEIFDAYMLNVYYIILLHISIVNRAFYTKIIPLFCAGCIYFSFLFTCQIFLCYDRANSFLTGGYHGNNPGNI